MYIQITTRCNMRCRHCCFSCTRKGEDMSQEVFSRALRHPDEYTSVTLGGGEPTVHPLFREFVKEALEERFDVTVITNGKRKRDALWLVDTAEENNNLSAFLSSDVFHEKVSNEVYWAFNGSRTAIGPLSNRVGRWGFGNTAAIPQGRWKGNPERRGECVCDDTFVKPNGDVALCGCTDSPVIASVWDKSLYPDEESPYRYVDCAKKLKHFPFRFYFGGQFDATLYIEDLPTSATFGRLSPRLGEVHPGEGAPDEHIMFPTIEGYATLCAKYGCIIPKEIMDEWESNRKHAEKSVTTD